MSPPDPIDMLFGGMAKLGPGSDADTLHVLRGLPARRFRVVVDAGCGTGRQTLVLASALDTVIHAVDSHGPFLDELVRRARAAGLEHRVQVHGLDMTDVPQAFPRIDLLWCEGAAYNVGFGNALSVWAPTLAPHGVAAVSELSWLTDRVPGDVQTFFRSAYPAMRSVPDNVAVARAAGYEVLATHTLPRSAWTEGYYDVLAPRARALLDHPDPSVRDLAAGTVEEIAIFDRSRDSYGYVFYALRHA